MEKKAMAHMKTKNIKFYSQQSIDRDKQRVSKMVQSIEISPNSGAIIDEKQLGNI
jgi:hypothetical protein